MAEPAAPDYDAVLRSIADLIVGGRAAEAADAAAALIRADPANIEGMRLNAIALMQLGRLVPARAALDNALAIAPQSIELLCNLGSVELAAGDAPAALAALERAFALAPSHPSVLLGLGNARRAGGDLAGAAEAYAGATRASPRHAGAWLNLAAAELALGANADAERNVRHALTVAPSHPEGLLLLGHVLSAQRRFSEAEAAYSAGARAAPADARFAYQTGLMAEEQKRFADAAAAHARALALDPSLNHALGQLVFLKRQLCDWRDLDALSADLRARVAQGARGIAPFGFLAEPAGADEQLQCARTFAAGVEASAAPMRAHLGWPHAARSAAQPRVGFVSNGFGNHPTGLLIVALIEALCDEPVHVEMFSTAADDASPIHKRLRTAADGWHDVVDLPPVVLAERLRAAELDVLVDLRGYGGGGIAEALALRPAPLQVNWLAYPGTSGAPWIDYVIADRIVLPDALRAHFSERVAYLPRCFQPSDPSRVVAEPPSRVACGLPEHGPVYVSFNNSYKLNPASMRRMFEVLRQVPESVLWLLSAPEGADDRLHAAAHSSGIDPARLVCMAKLPHAEYIARYRHADLFLDTGPYNAHTTASDAIWAGCPVLTVPGATFAARVAASLNAHLGVPQLNARDDDEFIEFAVRIGRDADARAALRAEVAAQKSRSGLFDMRGFARDFAALLTEISQRQRGGDTPGDIG
ncbi:MAG: tetratricopeptide repeat protein [Rhodanobacteraceae bacterium]